MDKPVVLEPGYYFVEVPFWGVVYVRVVLRYDGNLAVHSFEHGRDQWIGYWPSDPAAWTRAPEPAELKKLVERPVPAEVCPNCRDDAGAWCVRVWPI